MEQGSPGHRGSKGRGLFLWLKEEGPVPLALGLSSLWEQWGRRGLEWGPDGAQHSPEGSCLRMKMLQWRAKEALALRRPELLGQPEASSVSEAATPQAWAGGKSLCQAELSHQPAGLQNTGLAEPLGHL